MAFLAAVPWVIPLVGTVLSAVGQQKSGQAAQASSEASARAAEFEAQQQETLAGQERAASQRTAQERRRVGNLRESRALALAAASGGGASDPTVVKTISDLAAEKDYLARLALYGGESAATSRLNAAKAARYEAAQYRQVGGAARRAGNIAAAGTLFQGGASLYGKYGMPGSPTSYSPADAFDMGGYYPNPARPWG